MPSRSSLNIQSAQNGPRRATWYEIGMKYDRLGSLCNLELFWGTFAPTPKIIPSCKGSPNGHISYLFHTKLASWGHFGQYGCLCGFGMASGLRHCGIDIIAGIVSGSKMWHGFAQLRLSISWAWWFLAAIAHIEAVWIPLPCLDRAPATCSFRSYDFLWAVAETLEKQPYRQPRLFFLPSTTARAGMTAPLGYKGLG